VKKKPHRFYYGWVIVVVSFFTLFLTVSIRFSFGVFYVNILEEYGWGHGETAGAFSLAMVTYSCFAMVTGTLIDRFSPRTLFPLGATFLAIGLVGASRINAIWHLYLFFGVVMAIGINTLAFAPHMSLIPRWFIRKRGLASGLVSAGIGVGTMVLAPLIQFMIDTVGWRLTFLILAGIILGAVVPMNALFQRRSPEEVGEYPDGIVPGSGDNSPLQPGGLGGDTRSFSFSKKWRLRAALCTKAFWWMALVNFLVGFHINMLVVHQAAHVVHTGYTRMLAASLVGLVGLFASGGGILCGLLSDRVGREIAFTLGSSSAFVGVLLFLSIGDASSSWMLYAFVILYGLGYGSMGPICAAVTGDLFPGKSLGRILAIMTMGFALGGALGAYVGGYFYDRLASYTLPFLLLLVSISLGILGIWQAAPRDQVSPVDSPKGSLHHNR